MPCSVLFEVKVRSHRPLGHLTLHVAHSAGQSFNYPVKYQLQRLRDGLS